MICSLFQQDIWSLEKGDRQAVPSPRGVLAGLATPKRSTKPPKLKYEALLTQWSFYQIFKYQAPLHKRKSPLLKTFWRRFRCLGVVLQSPQTRKPTWSQRTHPSLSGHAQQSEVLQHLAANGAATDHESLGTVEPGKEDRANTSAKPVVTSVVPVRACRAYSQESNGVRVRLVWFRCASMRKWRHLQQRLAGKGHLRALCPAKSIRMNAFRVNLRSRKFLGENEVGERIDSNSHELAGTKDHIKLLICWSAHRLEVQRCENDDHHAGVELAVASAFGRYR